MDIGEGKHKCECLGVYGGDNCEKGTTSVIYLLLFDYNIKY